MKYILKSRILFLEEENKAIAKIKSSFLDAKKTIYVTEDCKQYQTDIDVSNVPVDKKGDVRFRIYKLEDESGNMLLQAHPCYAKDDDPDVVGWSICRAQKVDHANVMVNGTNRMLIMYNSQNYSLQNQDGSIVLQVMHNGIAGGWTILTKEEFSIEIICGLFIFCRYIEQENEFIVV